MINALAFVVAFHRRRWLAKAELPAGDASSQSSTGWRPWRLTERLDEAEKWSSEPAARAAAERVLPGGYEIRPIYGASPRSVA